MRLLKHHYFLIFIGILVAGRWVMIVWDSQFSGERHPFLQMVGQHSAIIKWHSKNQYKGVVEYGETLSKLRKIQEKIVTDDHELSLNYLKSDTQYWYKINQKVDSFFTAPDKNTDRNLLFWVLGDPGSPTKTLKKVYKNGIKWLNNRRLDLLLTTGDNAYSSGKNDEYQQSIFNIFSDVLSSVNLIPAFGNHDARRFAFFDIFNFPENAELGGVPSNTDTYFSFDYAQIHFVFLNSETHPLIPSNAMLDWLKQDLSHNQSLWTIALFHSPPYTKGSHDSDSWRDSLGRMIYMREKVVPILEKYDTDLVLNGHSHAFERSHLIRCHYDDSTTFVDKMVLDNDNIYEKNPGKTEQGGTVYAVIGSSSKMNKGKFNHPALPVVLAKTGSLMLKINQRQLSGYFIDENGVVLDEFMIDKTHSMTSNTSAIEGSSFCTKPE